MQPDCVLGQLVLCWGGVAFQELLEDVALGCPLLIIQVASAPDFAFRGCDGSGVIIRLHEICTGAGLSDICQTRLVGAALVATLARPLAFSDTFVRSALVATLARSLENQPFSRRTRRGEP